jgi:hypothetical protein
MDKIYTATAYYLNRASECAEMMVGRGRATTIDGGKLLNLYNDFNGNIKVVSESESINYLAVIIRLNGEEVPFELFYLEYISSFTS